MYDTNDINQELTIRSLSHGQSGDQVTLILPTSKGQRASVEKRRGGGQDESRLGRQALKQKTFPQIGRFEVPQIIRDWDGQSFSMEYAPGVALGTYLRHASHSQVNLVLEALGEYFNHIIDLSTMDPDFLSNDLSWQRKLNRMSEDHRTPLAREAVNWIRNNARNLSQRVGINHGDFSFENILVNPQSGQIWLIDMLDSPIESPLLDLGRILVDLEHGWWKTKHNESATELLARRQIALSLRRLVSQYSISETEVNFYKVFAALRILPYTQNPMRKAVLISVLKSIQTDPGS
jgi:hypothetical protein